MERCVVRALCRTNPTWVGVAVSVCGGRVALYRGLKKLSGVVHEACPMITSCLRRLHTPDMFQVCAVRPPGTQVQEDELLDYQTLRRFFGA